MKKIVFTLLLALLLSPFLSSAQISCFTSTNDIWEFEADINASVDCALPFYGGGCTTAISESTLLRFHLDGDVVIDECDMWCEPDGFDFSAINQNAIFASAMALANANTPKCVATGEEMLVVDLLFYIDVCSCTDPNTGNNESQLFLGLDVTYACCEKANDCQADFTIDYNPNVGECMFTVTNTSTPSSDNNCGDCDNPTGFTDVSWEINTVHRKGQLEWINPYINGSGYNFQFAPASLKFLAGYQICVTTTDCNGCVAQTCETIIGDFLCFGFTGGGDDKLISRRVESNLSALGKNRNSEKANDCQADFAVDYNPNVGECMFTVTNTITPSSDNDCGECDNPTGFTDVSWEISTVHQKGALEWINPYTNGSGYNFQFSPTSLKFLVGYQICVRTTDCNGCVAETCETIIGDFTCFGFTGGGEEELSLRRVETRLRSLEINPNPTSGFTNMTIHEKEFDPNNSRIEIYDLQGRMVDQLNSLSSGTNPIDLSQLSPSVYVVKLVIDGQVVQAEKIVVE